MQNTVAWNHTPCQPIWLNITVRLFVSLAHELLLLSQTTTSNRFQSFNISVAIFAMGIMHSHCPALNWYQFYTLKHCWFAINLYWFLSKWLNFIKKLNEFFQQIVNLVDKIQYIYRITFSQISNPEYNIYRVSSTISSPICEIVSFYNWFSVSSSMQASSQQTATLNFTHHQIQRPYLLFTLSF